MFAFEEHDHDCRLSSGRSLDYASRIYLTTSDILYANNSKPMFTIIEDTVGLWPKTFRTRILLKVLF